MNASDLFSFGVANLKAQAYPSTVELQELDSIYDQLPPFRLTVEEVDRMAGIDFENQTEAQRNCPVRINSKTD